MFPVSPTGGIASAPTKFGGYPKPARHDVPVPSPYAYQKPVWLVPAYLADAVQHLRDRGKSVPDALLAHTSPLTWEHIGFSGDFLWDRAAATADRRRPLNLSRGKMAA